MKSEFKEKREIQFNSMRSEIQNLKHILKSYEDQAVKLSDLEKKLRNQNTRHEKEMKEIEEKYKDKIKIFSKKLSKYEEMLIQKNELKERENFSSNKIDSFSRNKQIEEEHDRVNVLLYLFSTMMSLTTLRQSLQSQTENRLFLQERMIL